MRSGNSTTERAAAAHTLALAPTLRKLLVAGPPAGQDLKHPDTVLYRQLTSLRGPLLARAIRRVGTGTRMWSTIP